MASRVTVVLVLGCLALGCDGGSDDLPTRPSTPQKPRDAGTGQDAPAAEIDAPGASCAAPGRFCGLMTNCCEGAICIVQGTGVPVCAAECRAGVECQSGCCAQLEGSSLRVCGPATWCQGSTAPAVDAAPVACVPAGAACQSGGTCCGGAPCLGGVCAATCTGNGGCASGCCLGSLCAPASFCARQDAGTGPDTAPAACLPPGAACAIQGSCCGGFEAPCTQGICAGLCTTDTECASDCCLTSVSPSFCAPRSYCVPGGGGTPVPTGTNGVILAAAGDRWFAVATQWGDQLFEAQLFCANQQHGDAVAFTGSTAACASNTFTNARLAKPCDVWCKVSPDVGSIAAATDRTIIVRTRTDEKAFELGLGCRDMKPGDRVMFTNRAGSCLTQTLLNLRSGAGCDVRC